MSEPTDAEIVALADATRTAEGGANGYILPISFARAVLEKWGTPPAVAGEPVAYLHDDGYWTAAKTDAGRNLNDRLLFAGSPKVAVHTTPQPTRPQAGAVPLTVEKINAMAREYPAEDLCGWSYRMGVADTERHHGIKGDQHGTE